MTPETGAPKPEKIIGESSDSKVEGGYLPEVSIDLQDFSVSREGKLQKLMPFKGLENFTDISSLDITYADTIKAIEYTERDLIYMRGKKDQRDLKQKLAILNKIKDMHPGLAMVERANFENFAPFMSFNKRQSAAISSAYKFLDEYNGSFPKEMHAFPADEMEEIKNEYKKYTKGVPLNHVAMIEANTQSGMSGLNDLAVRQASDKIISLVEKYVAEYSEVTGLSEIDKPRIDRLMAEANKTVTEYREAFKDSSL